MGTRTKQVFETGQIAHLWAAQNPDQTDARNPQGNLAFSGTVLTSYGHYPIGNITDRTVQVSPGPGALRRRRLVLIQCNRYSSTTGKHISAARQALDGTRYTSLDVPMVTPGGRHDHASNLAYLDTLATDALAKIPGARSYAAQYCVDAERAITMARLYRVAYGLPMKGRPVLPRNWRTITRQAHARTRTAEQRAEQVDAAREARRAERQKMAESAAVTDRARWLAGELVNYPHGWNHENSPVLRLKPGEPDTVQTSRDAEIPLTHARRIWRTVQAIQAGTRAPFQANGHTIKAGVFTVDSIEADGTLRAGCHTFSFSALADFATRAGFDAPDAPDAPESGDDVCDRCGRSHVAVYETDEKGTVCVECSRGQA
jgi:hypothetical protein